MIKPIPFFSNSTQVSTANQEIIQPNKPTDYNGTFIPNYFNFYNVEDCHVLLNGSTTQMFIPGGGFEFPSAYQLQTLQIVEAGIHYNFSGVAPASVAITPSIGNGSHIIGLMVQPSQVTLNLGDTQQITVTAVRPVQYNNSTMPQGTVYYSSNETVATVSNTGLISYVGSGYCQIVASNNGFFDIINVTCI